MGRGSNRSGVGARAIVGLLLGASVHAGCAADDPASSGIDADSGASWAGSDTTAGPATDGDGGDTASPAPSTPGPLVDLAAWVPVAADADPWADERPADAVCDAGHRYEDMVFEVDSEICTFGTFVQPSLLPVRAGDELELILLHDNLYSTDEDAEAHVAIGLDGAMIWDTTIPIPMLQSLVRPTFVAPADAPAGTPVHFHVHNHGYNNYRMIQLEIR
jgi:hypothetical protein